MKNRKLSHYRKKRFTDEDVNPMETVANLVDVMLVFACALMIAIISHWNVDLSKVVDVIDETEMVKVDDLTETIKDDVRNDKYKSKGAVYEDPETGEMYIISN